MPACRTPWKAMMSPGSATGAAAASTASWLRKPAARPATARAWRRLPMPWLVPVRQLIRGRRRRGPGGGWRRRGSRSRGYCRSELGQGLAQGINQGSELLHLGLAEVVVVGEACAGGMLLEPGLQGSELGLERFAQVRVLLLQRRQQALEGGPGSVNVGLEVPEIGVGPDFFLPGNFAGGHLVQELLGAVADLVRGEFHSAGPLGQVLGVGNKLRGDGGTLRRCEGRVAGRREQVLLGPVPAGPFLAGCEVGFTGIELGVQVPERLGDRLDALPVHARGGIEPAGLRRIP